MTTTQRRPGGFGKDARVLLLRDAAVVLAMVLALAASAAGATPVARTTHGKGGRVAARAVTAEPVAVKSRAGGTRAGGAKGATAKAGTARAGSSKAGSSKAGSSKARAAAGGAAARRRGGAAGSSTRGAGGSGGFVGQSKETLKGKPQVQAKRRRRRRAEEVDETPVTMYRVQNGRGEGAGGKAEPQVAERTETKTALTVEDFERAASGAAVDAAGKEPAGADAVGPEVEARASGVEKSPAAVRRTAAAPQRVVTTAKVGQVGGALPMMVTAQKAAPRGVAKVQGAAPAVKVPARMEANRPKEVAVQRAAALPRMEAEAGDDKILAGDDDGAASVAGQGEATAAAGSSAAAEVATVEEERGLKALAVRAPSHEEMALAAVQPVVLPGLYRDGRLVVPAPLKGSREILVHQNTMADEEGLERIRNEQELNRLRASRQLVEIPESASLWLNPELPWNRRCARAWSVRFAEDMSRAFYARFGEPIKVTSAVRTVAYQLRLQRVNGNAAGVGGEAASPHLTGQAIDFAKSGMNVQEIAWMRSYLLPLMQAGKVDVEEEFQQACFHISVYRSYMPVAPVRRRGVRTEVAQLPAAAKVAGPSEEERQ